MDPKIENMLEQGESIVWRGVIKRSVLNATLVVSLLTTLVISGFIITGTPAPSAVNGMVSGSLAGITVLLIGVAVAVFKYFSDRIREYAITQKRVLIKSGLIGTDFKSVYFEQMINVIADVGIVGKLFSVGSVKIDTGRTESYSTGSRNNSHTSTRTAYDTLKYIDNPYDVYNILQKTLTGRREKLYSGKAYTG